MAKKDTFKRNTDSLSSVCNLCGVPILFASDVSGKSIALDIRAYPIYMLIVHEGIATARSLDGYISHIAMCTKTNNF